MQPRGPVRRPAQAVPIGGRAHPAHLESPDVEGAAEEEAVGDRVRLLARHHLRQHTAVERALKYENVILTAVSSTSVVNLYRSSIAINLITMTDFWRASWSTRELDYT